MGRVVKRVRGVIELIDVCAMRGAMWGLRRPYGMGDLYAFWID